MENTSELAKLKRQYKKYIEKHLQNMEIEQAQYLISEFEKVNNPDVEIFTYKGIAAYLLNDYEKAEFFFKEGLLVNNSYPDLLFNLGMVNEKRSKLNDANRYYKRALKATKDESLISLIEDRINEIESDPNISQLVKKRLLIIDYQLPKINESAIVMRESFIKIIKEQGWEPIVVTAHPDLFDKVDVIAIAEPEYSLIEQSSILQVQALYNKLVNKKEVMNEFMSEVKNLGLDVIQPNTSVLWAVKVINDLEKQLDLYNVDQVYSLSDTIANHLVAFAIKEKYNKPWVSEYSDKYSCYSDDPGSVAYKVEYCMEDSLMKTANAIILNVKDVKQEKLNLSEDKVTYLEFAKPTIELAALLNDTLSNFDLQQSKPKICFFYFKTGDKFLNDIIEYFSRFYSVRRVAVQNKEEIEEDMRWADICWFEWCNNILVHATNLPIAMEKKIICRIHRYEVFTDIPRNVEWGNVDKAIVVTDHLKKLLELKVPNIENMVEFTTIKNGVDLSKFTLLQREKGYNIAFVGHMIPRKNPMMLLQIAKKLVEKDSRYKVFIAGNFEDEMLELYWIHMVKELELEQNVFFEGYQVNIDDWLEDKQYILSTTMHESFGYGIAEAMARGIKPVIHNFLYSKEIWPEKYLFNTVDEAVEIIESSVYSSEEYRDYITDNYSLDNQLTQTNLLFEEMSKNSDVKASYTISYNGHIIRMFLPNPKDYIQKVIRSTGSFYEQSLLDFIYSKGLNNKVVIDVGANIGNHTLFFSSVCQAKKVHSFEPLLQSFEILQKNVEINGLGERVQVHNIALGNRVTKGNTVIVDEKNLGMTQLEEDEHGSIQISTLDEIFQGKIENLDLIKIDVEGMGTEVLLGGLKIISQFKPDIIIEAATERELTELKDILFPLGYELKNRYNGTPTYFLQYRIPA